MRNKINFEYNKYDFYHNEWYFNIYTFNKYINIHGIILYAYIYNILNYYFNNTIKKYINKIFFTITEIKFFSDKLIIYISIYNREKNFLLEKLQNLKLKDKRLNNFNKKLKLLNNKLYLYNYYSAKLFINNLKINTYNMFKLKNILSKLLDRKILFNVTSHKYFHLNKDIMLDLLTEKINKNRKKSILNIIRKSLMYAKIAKLHYLLKIKNLNNLIKNNVKTLISKKNNYLNDNVELIKEIFKKGVNLHTIGFRLESKGRLTKRLVAAKTIKKINNKGILNNIHSSVNRNSIFLFKGFERSNINFSNKNNDNLLGSYGIKYWVSSY
jgi:ribosomal protein L28